MCRILFYDPAGAETFLKKYVQITKIDAFEMGVDVILNETVWFFDTESEFNLRRLQSIDLKIATEARLFVVEQLDSKTNGAKKRGKITASVRQITNIFGEPSFHEVIGNTRLIHWVVKTPFGYASIHNRASKDIHQDMDSTSQCEEAKWEIYSKTGGAYLWLMDKLQHRSGKPEVAT